MKLIVGLGNPGEKYEGTRHNVGFFVLDELKAKISHDQFLISKHFQNLNFKFQKKLESEVVRLDDIILVKPQTFMNRSGIAVKKLTTSYKLQATNLYVVHDDLDIPLGKYKIQLGKGPRVHWGLQSIYQHLGSEEFWHVRIGIENRERKVKSQKSPKIRQLADTGRAKVKSFGKEYVLQRFEEDELPVIKRAISEVVQVLVARLLG